MKKWILALAVLIGSAALSHGAWHGELCEGFLPENDLNIPASFELAAGGISEEQFNEVLDRVQGLFESEVAKNGASLMFNRKWEDGTVNASAQRFGKTWVINMYGGLARHPSITEDGFALVACHEMGHHLGGAPKIGGWFINKWASNEGAADYYATLKCMRRLFASDDNEKILADMTLDPLAVRTCEEQHIARRDQLLCIRGAHAGLSVAGLFHALRKQKSPINFATPDSAKVKKTDNKHPAPQCRLDTYLAGAVCKVPVHEALSDRDFRKGSCGDARVFTVGLRPRCWFQPGKKGRKKDRKSGFDDEDILEQGF